MPQNVEITKTFRRILFGILIMSLVLPSKTFAHSGRTDGRGGHTDHGTGGYHYHHGYPAHDHYDMDGDGIIDCPYDFDDKSSSQDNVGSDESTKSDTTIVPPKAKKKISFSDILSRVFMAAVALLIVPYLLFIISIIPSPVTWLLDQLAKLSTDQNRAYRRWFILITIVADIFVIYKIFTLK